MVAAALLYKVKSWLTGSYFSEFSCRSSLFLGLVVMNCSNSIAIDLMSSVCMTAVGFPFFGGATSPLTRNPPIVWFPVAQRSVLLYTAQRRPREKTKWSEPEILVCLCWLLLHPPFHCSASRTSRATIPPMREVWWSWAVRFSSWDVSL